jgi:sigma-B regulation protein RsbU (phosphoserine phosphatase)
LLFRAGDERPRELDAEGRFLGMLPGLKLEECSIQLEPGDLIVMFSDGVPDAINFAEESYGEDRLINLLSRYRSASADQVCMAIFKDVFAYRGTASAFDDITVLVARCDG